MSNQSGVTTSRSNANGRANISLFDSATAGNMKGVREAILSGANVNTKFENDWTALHKAAQFGHQDICKELIAKNASVDNVQICKWTPLHVAASSGQSSVAEYLIQRKCDVNACDDTNLNSLMQASMEGDIATVRLLLKEKADVFAVSKNNRSSVIMAISRGHDAIVEMLLNAEDVQGQEREIERKKIHSDLQSARESMMQQNSACGLRSTLSEREQAQQDEKLWQSAKSGFLDGVRTAIEAGANPHERSAHHIDAMEAARSSSNRRCYAFLRAYEQSNTVPTKYWNRQDVLRYIEGNLPLSIPTNHVQRELNKIPKLNGNVFRSAYVHHLLWHELQLTPQQRLALCRSSTALRHGFKLVQHQDDSVACTSRQYENPRSMEDLRKHTAVSQFLAFFKARVGITAHLCHTRQHRHMPLLPILMRGESVEEFEADERCLAKKDADPPVVTAVPRSMKIADRMRWWKSLEWEMKYCGDAACDRCGSGHPLDPSSKGSFGLEAVFGEYTAGVQCDRNICHSSDQRLEVTEKDPIVVRPPTPNFSPLPVSSSDANMNQRANLTADTPHILASNQYPPRDSHAFSKINGSCQQTTKVPKAVPATKTCGFALKHPEVKRTYRLHLLCDGLWALPALCTSQKQSLRQCNNAHPGIVLKLTDNQVLKIGPYLIYVLWVISQHIRANGSRLLALVGNGMKCEDIPEPLERPVKEDEQLPEEVHTPVNQKDMRTGSYHHKKVRMRVNVQGYDSYFPGVENEIAEALSTPILRPGQLPALSPHERAILSRMGVKCDHRSEPIPLEYPPTDAKVSMLPIIFPKKLADKMRAECDKQREQQEEIINTSQAAVNVAGAPQQQRSRAWMALQKRIRDGDVAKQAKKDNLPPSSQIASLDLSPLSPISIDTPPMSNSPIDNNVVSPPISPIHSVEIATCTMFVPYELTEEEQADVSSMRDKMSSMDGRQVNVLKQVITAFKTGGGNRAAGHRRVNSGGSGDIPVFDRALTTTAGTHVQESARPPSSRTHTSSNCGDNSSSNTSSSSSSSDNAKKLSRSRSGNSNEDEDQAYEESIVGQFWLQQVELLCHSNGLEILQEFQRKRENLLPKEMCPQLQSSHQMFHDDVNVLWEVEIEQALCAIGMYPTSADAFQYESMAALFATYCTHPEELGKCIENAASGVYSNQFENPQGKHTAVCEARSVLLRLIEHCDGESWKAPTQTAGLKRVKDCEDVLDLWMCHRHAEVAELLNSDRFQALNPGDKHTLDDSTHFKTSPANCNIM